MTVVRSGGVFAFLVVALGTAPADAQVSERLVQAYLWPTTVAEFRQAEAALATDRSLVQVSAGPGRADSIIDDDGHSAFTVSGRVQLDVTPRTAVVASGMFRGTSDQDAHSSAGGVALGFAPTAWLTTWTSLDARFQELDTTDKT